MPIPSLDPDTGYLPEGVHKGTFEDIEQRFGTNYRRKKLVGGLKFVVERLTSHGVSTIWIAGSFVTSKERPGDVDVIYDSPPSSDPMTWGVLSPVRRQELKHHQGVDLWKHPASQPSKTNPMKIVPLVEWMSTDRDGLPKGVVELVKEVENDS